MQPADHRLRDCAHIGQMAGICQYEGCAKQLCPHCVQSCETCGTVLCPAHQVWLDGRRRAFCKAHAKKYLIMKAVRWITPGLGTQQATDRTTPRNVAAADAATLRHTLRGDRHR